VERLGIEKVRKETVYAAEKQKKSLLKRLQKAKALSSDAWMERQSPVNPTQFVQIEPMEARPPMARSEAMESVLQ